MSVDPRLELAQFKQFIAEHVDKGNSISPEEALDLWRLDHPRANEFADDLRAVRAALNDLDAGDLGVPLEEFEREFRDFHGLSADE